LSCEHDIIIAMQRGFTLIELLISVAIFVIMTSLVVAKYGNFNTSTLLTDTAYDVALALRTAQTYGLSVKNASAVTANFSVSYGVDFRTGAGGSCGGQTSTSNATNMVLFADTATPNNICDPNDTLVDSYLLTRGAVVSGLCAGTGSSCTVDGSVSQLDVTYLRPNPEATICINGSCGSRYTYAEVVIKGTDGSTRTIAVYENGQISIINQ